MRGRRLNRCESLPRGVSQLACVLAIFDAADQLRRHPAHAVLVDGWWLERDVAQLISDSRIERSRRARLGNPDMMRPQ